VHLPAADVTIPIYLALIPSLRWSSGRITVVRRVDGIAKGGNTIILRATS
jgi:hypothetical protein